MKELVKSTNAQEDVKHYAFYIFSSMSAVCVHLKVFSVLESTYQHDSLRYLLDFFIPAKHLLHRLQQHACVSMYTYQVIVKGSIAQACSDSVSVERVSSSARQCFPISGESSGQTTFPVYHFGLKQ